MGRFIEINYENVTKNVLAYFMSGESIKFCNTVTKETVSVDNPDLALRATQLSSKSESTSNTQRPKCPGIQPP